MTAHPLQGLSWSLLKLNTRAGAGQPSSALGCCDSSLFSGRGNKVVIRRRYLILGLDPNRRNCSEGTQGTCYSSEILLDKINSVSRICTSKRTVGRKAGQCEYPMYAKSPNLSATVPKPDIHFSRCMCVFCLCDWLTPETLECLGEKFHYLLDLLSQVGMIHWCQ